MNNEELKILQCLPLDLKVAKSKLRIRDAINKFGHEGLYLSFSGGKDSTVLHHLVKEVEMDLYGEIRIPRVFCNTGLEYPELVNHVKNIFNSLGDLGVIIRPSITFNEVLTRYGYPVVSKEQSQYIGQYRNARSEKTKILRLEGNKWGRGKISKKWRYLLDSDFKISDQCCNVMKKKPFKQYEKITGKVPILGIMAGESELRKSHYLKNGGCNAFEGKRPQSKPIGFWTEQDILKYILDNNIIIPSVYGSIKKIDDKYITTGATRTGCVFCMFGIHLEKDKNRFELLKETHPKLYDYCLRGGKYDNDGNWIPYQGLGMKHILDTLKARY